MRLPDDAAKECLQHTAPFPHLAGSATLVLQCPGFAAGDHSTQKPQALYLQGVYQSRQDENRHQQDQIADRYCQNMHQPKDRERKEAACLAADL